MKRLLFYILFISQLVHAQEYVAFVDVNSSTSRISEIASPPNASSLIPFTMVEGMMLVEAEIDNQKGNFIIDTGAPTLVLNENPTDHTVSKGRGISDGLNAAEVIVKDFSWATIQKRNLNAFKVDISHLALVAGKPIAGIIGYDILKEVELFVNYETKTVQLGAVSKTTAPAKSPIAVIPFTMQGHLPVIKVKIGKKKIKLALDTASESNILDSKYLKKMNTALLVNRTKGEMQGVDQQIKEVAIATISGTSIQEIALGDMKYLFTNLNHLKSESNLYIDGLLGFPFFKQGKMSINYKEKKLYIWSLEVN